MIYGTVGWKGESYMAIAPEFEDIIFFTFRNIRNDKRIPPMAYVEKEGLWLFLTEHFPRYADFEILKRVIKNPPEERSALLKVLHQALRKLPPVDLEQPTHAVVSYGFEELWDRIVYPEDHKFDMSPFDRVFLEFLGGFRSEIMDALADAIYICGPATKSTRSQTAAAKSNTRVGKPEDLSWMKRRTHSANEAADILHVAPRTVRNLIKRTDGKRLEVNDIGRVTTESLLKRKGLA